MTTPTLQTALSAFADELKRLYRDLGLAQPEDQLKGPVQRLLGEAGKPLGVEVATLTEVKLADVSARPDIGVDVGGLICGYVELKAPGKGARPERLSGGDRVQWQKLQALPNLVYTDGIEWALYRGGTREGEVLRLGDVVAGGGKVISSADAHALQSLLADFLGWQPIVPNTPKALAAMLAPLCRLLRDEACAALSKENSAITKLAAEWRSVLFPDADDAQFADAYAQTLTYAMLLARFSGERDMRLAEESLTAHHHDLLAQALRVLADPAARREIEVPVRLLERAIGAIDPVALYSKDADPWLYFYEDFLAAYDAKLRNNRGVYYTPVQVVEAQIRLTAEILHTRFGKPLDFADDHVTVLDPGLGTGTYLLAALRHGLDQVRRRFGEGALAGRATQAASNLHGFEILVGPYAVARLRFAQQVLEAKGELPADGAHIYLTDTLESPFSAVESQMQHALLHQRLAAEHRRAQEVKLHTPVMVCIGNPPYDRQHRDPDDPTQDLKGGWVRFGDPQEPDKPGILEAFMKPARDAGAGVHLKNLYNDYIYFWRWALWKVFERTQGPGIVCFITAASYLRGPGFVGMRRVMRQTFDDLWIIDLEGDNLGARKTENVFAIQIPVAIALGVRYGPPKPETPAAVHYSRLEGTRETKLRRLAEVGVLADLSWQEAYAGWDEPMLPEGEGDYFTWPAVTDVFPWQQPGVKAGRTWCIDSSRTVLERRWRALAATDPNQRAVAFKNSPTGRKTTDQPLPLTDGSDQRLTAVSQIEAEESVPTVETVAYRAFDRQRIFADARLLDRASPSLWTAHGPRQLYLTSLLTGVLGEGPAAVATALIPDLDHFRGSYGGKHVIPLYRNAKSTETNVTAGYLDAIGAALASPGSHFSEAVTHTPVLTAEDLFAYSYAIMAHPGYVERFSEELTIPGPRLPITKDAALFAEVVALGRRLVWLHTFGERWLPQDEVSGHIPQGAARCTVAVPGTEEGYPTQVSYDAAARTISVGDGQFAPVEPVVWGFGVSGLKVVQSWLRYRMRDGAGRKSSPLDNIRMERWPAAFTEELLELLWVLEATIALYPALNDLLSQVVAGPLFRADELPTPTPAEREAPAARGKTDRRAQLGLGV